jgi:Zn-dependent oligopeptidase
VQRKNDGDTREILENVDCVCKANLMGKKNFAEWKIQDQMAQTPESHEFISKNRGAGSGQSQK